MQQWSKPLQRVLQMLTSSSQGKSKGARHVHEQLQSYLMHLHVGYHFQEEKVYYIKTSKKFKEGLCKGTADQGLNTKGHTLQPSSLMCKTRRGSVVWTC
jgi:hypothetical protein